jgi:hypothetical protein
MLNFLKAVDIILLCRRKLNEKGQTGLADLEATNDNGRQKPQDIDPIQVSKYLVVVSWGLLAPVLLHKFVLYWNR